MAVKWLLFNKSAYPIVAALLLAAEAVLGVMIIKRIAYTEIDWVAYMQEVGGFLEGERDYENLKGDTGPLVYPAGFVYIYSALYHITSSGANILLAQYIFLGVYLATQAVAFYLHYLADLPPWTLAVLCISKRVHSIYMLRCFNDTIAMLFAYISLACLAKHRHLVAAVLISLAVSVKMNALLMVPGYALVFVREIGVRKSIMLAVLVVAVQLVLALPFLLTYPTSYFAKAFEFSRVFTHKWTVNLKFLDPETFVSKPVALSLLLYHVLSLLAFLAKWTGPEQGIGAFIFGILTGKDSRLSNIVPSSRQYSPAYILLITLTCNFIGITFARTLHYQFYSWYFHSLAILLFYTPFPLAVKALVIFGIEYAFNVYPATPTFSLVLQVCHVTLLIGLLVFNINKIQRVEVLSTQKKIN